MFDDVRCVRESLVHVHDGPNRKNVDLAAVLRAPYVRLRTSRWRRFTGRG
ncbi:hypothetical protein PV646_41150 [Streptomyces sp. ID05-26A]|nr:hypothetical protein [Streptomyces sp. ID05-26A]